MKEIPTGWRLVALLRGRSLCDRRRLSPDRGTEGRRSPPRSSATSASSTTAASTRTSSPVSTRRRRSSAIKALSLKQSNSVERLHPEPDVGRAAARRHRHRGRLPARQRDRDDGEEVPGHALRDHRLSGRGGSVRRQEGQALFTERRGPDLRGQRGRLPRRRARGARWRADGQEDRSAPSAGVKIPPVDIWIAGYKYCAQKAVPGTKVLIGYSQDFVATDKCKTVAENQIAQGAQVLFQVAGGCGLGTLKAADEAGKWGIGVDVDQYTLAKRVLTSAVKRVDTGVYHGDQAGQGRQVPGRQRPRLQPEERRHRASARSTPPCRRRTSPLMNSYKAKIIAGKLKVPAAL